MNAELVMLDVLTVALGNKGGLGERAISQLLSTETIVKCQVLTQYTAVH